MKGTKKYHKLLQELSRDPRVKQVMAKAARRPRQKAGTKVETATSMFVLLSMIVSRFTKKKRARAIEELADTVQFLVQLSLMLKENIFDRPEVKKFFRQRSKQIYVLAQDWLSRILPAGTGTGSIAPKRPRISSRPGHRGTGNTLISQI